MATPVKNENRPRILIVADKPNWAYHQIAMFIKTQLSDRYDIDIEFLIFNDNIKPRKIYNRIIKETKKFYYSYKYKNNTIGEYDIVLYLGWYMDTMGGYKSQVNAKKIKTKRIIKGIYTDGFPPKGYTIPNKISREQFYSEYLSDADAIVCGSKNIVNFYKNFNKYTIYANSFLDADLFKPNLKKNYYGKTLNIGWTGNPEREFKGYYDFVVPAVNKAQTQRPGINLKTKFHGSMKSLASFYNDIHLTVIASEADAGPSLFAEAALSGVMSISTVIGWPSQIIENKVNGIFVKRDVEEIVKTIIYLYDSRDVLEMMNNRIRKDYLLLENTEFHKNQWDQLFRSLL